MSNKKVITRKDAFNLFGEMRSSTPEEQAAMRKMLDKLSVPIEGVNIFDLDMEKGETVTLQGNIMDYSNSEQEE